MPADVRVDQLANLRLAEVTHFQQSSFGLHRVNCHFCYVPICRAQCGGTHVLSYRLKHADTNQIFLLCIICIHICMCK